MSIKPKRLIGWSKWDCLAFLITIFAGILTAYIGVGIYEGIPHIEDEITYVWEAKAIAGGQFILESLPCPDCFQVPFVIDYQGKRFGKYPLGWPVVLSFGIRFGIREWISPIISALTIWLIYRLSRKMTGPGTSIMTIVLVTSSPFYLMNASSLLAHGWSLLLSVIFTIGWIDTFYPTKCIPAPLSIGVAGLSLGVLALTRPITALGVAIPFIIHGFFLLVHGPVRARWTVVIIGLLSATIASLHLVWQYACTGNALLNPYTLWWSYDRVGFGQGIGLQEGGFSLKDSWANTNFSLWVGEHDLFGWPYLSWIFLIPGVIASAFHRKTWIIIGIPISLVLIYSLYWIGSWLLGPRYYYEGIFSLALFSAAGMKWLLGDSVCQTKNKLFRLLNITRRVIISGLIFFLLAGNFLFYLPNRLGGLLGYYGISRSQLQSFLSPTIGDLTPALIIVHKKDSWKEYGALLELSDPYFSTPLIFSLSLGDENDQQIIKHFPERKIWHYYAEEPYKLYSSPQ